MTLSTCETFVPTIRLNGNHKGFYLFVWLILTSSLVKRTLAWDSDEMELFDLVEEVNTNFYLLLGVSEDADAKEVKKAFRKLTLVLHPDKNDAPDADVQFRHLVSVYEVLLDEQKRARYNDVLKNGIPDWKHAIYYYRRVRKMGLLEMAVILFLIITVGQYIVLWAAYAERKYTAEELMSTRMKKIQKKQKKGKIEVLDGMQDIQLDLLDFPKPSVYDLLPFQSARLMWLIVTGAPQCFRLVQALLAERRRQKLEEAEESSEESAREDEGEERREKRVRRRKAFLPPELSHDNNSGSLLAEDQDSKRPKPVARKIISGGLWTDDDFTELARLIKKFPGGISQRWEKIADAMNRSVAEVTHMARKMKEENYRPAPLGTSEDTPVDVNFKASKVKTKGGKLARGQTEMPDDGGTERDIEEEFEEEEQPQVLDLWSQPQQKALENALTKFTKGTSERWVKIAKSVPGKNMEECIARYKVLVEIIKKKKQQSQPQQQPNSEQSQQSAEDNCEASSEPEPSAI